MTAAKLKARYDFGQGNKFGSPTQAKVYGEPGISIKDFVREKKSATEKKERATETLNLKLNTKPLNLNSGRGGGRAGRPMQGMGTPT
jgi:hypothetical protein